MKRISLALLFLGGVFAFGTTRVSASPSEDEGIGACRSTCNATHKVYKTLSACEAACPDFCDTVC